MSPPAKLTRIGEARQTMLEMLQGQSLEALGTAYPYLGENTDTWGAAVTEVAPTLLQAQQAGVTTSDKYLVDALNAQGAPSGSDVRVRPQGFLDLSDSGGSWMSNLLYAPPSAYRTAVKGGYGTAVAAARARFIAQVVTLDGLRDSARSADNMGMFGRRTTLYIRMLRGTSCSRCAILAGRVYKVESFQRHPNCDCYQMPVDTATNAAKWKTSPSAYFNSLSEPDQDRIFGEGSAAAVRASRNRDFALSQVVNADQSTYKVTAYGRPVTATRSGTTVRGIYGGYEVQPDGSFRKRSASEYLTDKDVSAYRFTRTPRLVPDQILTLSREFGWSRDMTIAQFRRFGYVY